MILLSLSLSLSIFLLGCGSTAPTPGTAPAATEGSVSRAEQKTAIYDLRLQESIVSHNLEVKWLEVDDSRCPLGTNCIWQGKVVVTLEVRERTEKSKPDLLELSLLAGQEPVAASITGHTLKLLSLEPHPKAGVDPKSTEYRCQIEITEARATVQLRLEVEKGAVKPIGRRDRTYLGQHHAVNQHAE